MKQKPSYLPKKYKYSARTGNLKAEAVGVVKGEKHFPVFKGNLVFKPLTKSKPLSTPLFAYAEVFWSWLIFATLSSDEFKKTAAAKKNLCGCRSNWRLEAKKSPVVPGK